MDLNKSYRLRNGSGYEERPSGELKSVTPPTEDQQRRDARDTEIIGGGN
jgi:hypothetical protein